MADSESDAGYRSRSQSRRRRRQNQRQRAATSEASAGDSKANAAAMTSVPEAGEESQTQTQLSNPHASDVTEMKPFDRIQGASDSMDGPVTYARAMRGEIPMRGAAPQQDLSTTQQGKTEGRGDIMDQDGLKLRLELNLDIEIELKASIHGDLTLAIMS